MPNNIDAAIKLVLEEYGAAIVDATRQSIGFSGKVASGNLQNSVVYDVNDTTLEIWAASYLKAVEDGRRANAPLPPINEIIAWMQFRNITPEGIVSRQVTNSKTGKTRTRRDGVELAQKKAAFAIAHSIAQKGIPSTGIIRPVLNQIQDPLTEKVSQVVANILGEEIADDWRKAANEKLQITVEFDKR